MRRLSAVLTAATLFTVLHPGAATALDAETLQDTLAALIANHPTAKRTNVALKVTDLETGEVLFDQNSDKLFTPASNLKIYTSAAALDLLGPDYRWTTLIFEESIAAAAEEEELSNPGIYLVGGADPMLDTEQLQTIADRVSSVVSKQDGSSFLGLATRKGWDSLPLKGPGWMWDDDPDYYNMSIQPFMLNFNVSRFIVRPGDAIGDPPQVEAVPGVYESPYGKIRSMSPYLAYGGVTVSEGKTTIQIDRNPFNRRFFLSGDMSIDSNSTEFNLTVHDPSDWIEQVLLRMVFDRTRKPDNQIDITPVVNTVSIFDLTDLLSGTNSGGGSRHIYSSDKDKLLFEHQGKTNAEAVKHFLKKSENAVGEMLLLTLSEKFGDGDKVSWPSGATVISDWLVEEAGLERDSFRLVDGSGLSRYNLISADSSIRLLDYMKNESPHFEPFFDGLPIYKVDLPKGGGAKWGGVPLAEFDDQRVFAKPGGMSGVSTISGYVQTLDGRWLAFSLLGNGYIGSSAPVRDLRNQVWTALVQYQSADVVVPAE